MTEKGLSLTSPGALVHRPGQKGAVGPSHASRLPRSLPRKRKSRQSAAVLGPRWGRVPLTGTSDGIAPRRFSFSRGRTGKGLTLTRSGALVHVSGQAVRPRPFSRALPFSRLSTHPLFPSKTKVAAERCPSGAEVGTCVAPGTVAIDPPRLSIFGGGEGEGPVAHLSWGSPAPSWGEAGGRPFSRLSTRPVVPSKLKVAAERCPSGAEVGTCVAPRNGCRNRSATTSVFEGGEGEGPVAHLSWGPCTVLGRSGRSALLTPLDSPGISLEIESRGRALPFWGRGGDVCRSSERVSESIRHDFGFRGGR